MPRVSSIELMHMPKMPTLSFRTRTPFQSLPELIGSTYTKMGEYLHEMGEMLADMPYVAYYNMDMENLDVEMGFPVRKHLPEKGDLKQGEIGAEKAVFCIFRGPYEQMSPTYDEIMKWMEERQLRPTGVFFECYLNGPEDVGPEEFLTKILIPVE